MKDAVVLKTLGGEPGEFKLTVLVGGKGSEEPLSQSLGTIELVFPQGSAERINLSTTVENKIGFKPEIYHTFRGTEKTPPIFISLLFAGVVLTPWIVLIGLVWNAF